MTTHYMDEAENCDRIAIIDEGRIIALDTPDRLKDEVGGDIVSLTSDDPGSAVRTLRERYDLDPRIEDGVVAFRVARGDEWLPEFVRTFPHRLSSINVRRPTLDDVFVALTGRAIREEGSDEESMRRWRRRRRMGGR